MCSFFTVSQLMFHCDNQCLPMLSHLLEILVPHRNCYESDVLGLPVTLKELSQMVTSSRTSAIHWETIFLPPLSSQSFPMLFWHVLLTHTIRNGTLLLHGTFFVPFSTRSDRCVPSLMSPLYYTVCIHLMVCKDFNLANSLELWDCRHCSFIFNESCGKQSMHVSCCPSI